VSPERFVRVGALFEAACDLPRSERGAFLAEACAGDHELRAEVESLLSNASGAATQADGLVRSAADPVTEPRKQRRIGAYRLVREIGSGGMGAVYLAVRDDDAYRRQVAIKLLHQGFETGTAVARFRDERQILATLEHPGIVRLLDGGSTDEGLPYLVMEHVEGVPITQWAEARRLAVADRVALFRKVCDAVAYAHQKLVVHRDIKPGNILVTADGAPKLLDFGIAKLNDPSAELRREAQTRTGVHLLTPEYASPEQVRGESASIASDVYSLGVVLYEMLTGSSVHPFARGGALESMRAKLEVDASKPSSKAPEGRRRAIVGDLDNILLKALHREPGRRYASVEQFSADLGRHLGGEPVQARAATLRYRTAKFVRRHRGALAALVAVLASMTVATAVSLMEARRADEQAQRAQRRFDDVRRLANAMLFDVDEQLVNVEGAITAREVLVNHVLAYMDSLAGEAEDDPALQRELAEAYVKVGDIQGGPFVANLSRVPEAIATHTEALALFERLAAAGHGDVAMRWQMAWVHCKLSAHNTELADYPTANLHTLAAIEIVESQPTDGSYEYGLAALVYNRQIRRDVSNGDLAGIERHARAAIEVADRWQAADRPRTERHVQIDGMRSTAIWRIHSGDPDAAARAQDAATTGFAGLIAESPHNRQWLYEYTDAALAGAWYHGAVSHRWDPSTGEVAVAEVQLEDLVERIEAHLAAEPKDEHMRTRLKHALGLLAATVGERDPLAALALFERGEGVASPVEDDQFYLCTWAVALARVGRRDEALAALDRGLAETRRLAERRRRGLLVPISLTRCLYMAAQMHHALGDDMAAAAHLEEGVTVARTLLTKHPGVVMPYVALVTMRELQAALVPARRCELLADAEAVWRAWPNAATAYTRRRLLAVVEAQAGCPQAG
jgi:tetratricopeptide (TPR) repeat protein